MGELDLDLEPISPKVSTAAASRSKIINSQLGHWVRESFGCVQSPTSRCIAWDGTEDGFDAGVGMGTPHGSTSDYRFNTMHTLR